jgi:hypothetical protein
MDPRRPHRSRLHQTVVRPLLGVTALLGLLLGPAPLRGQVESVTSLHGVVRDRLGDPVSGATVRLLRNGRTVGAETTTDGSGRFVVERVTPGRYALQTERFGYFPQVVTDLVVRPRRRVDLSIRLREGQPPFDRVDSIQAGDPGVDGRRWIDDPELGAPAGSRGIDAPLGLATRLDRQLGSTGLPSRLTTYTVQGVPFRAAATGPGRQDAPALLTVGSVGLALVEPVGGRHSRSLSGGGGIEVFNPRGEAGETEVLGAGSWGALWSGGTEAEDGNDPLGFWFGARSSIHFRQDSLVLTLGADGYGTEVPRPPLFPGSEAPENLSAPGSENLQAGSVFALLDWELGNGSRLDLGARFGLRGGAEDLSPLTYPRGVAPAEARDLVVGAGLLTDITSSLDLSFRLGFTRSDRTGSGDWPLTPETPFVVDVARRRAAGIDPTYARPGRRDGVYAAPTFKLRIDGHELRGGFEYLRSGHDLGGTSGPVSWVGSGDPFADGWSGAATGWQGLPDERGFTVNRLSAFVADTWTPRPGTQIFLEGRWSRETLPTERLEIDPVWASVTGTSAEGPPSAATGLGGHLGMEIKPGGSGLVLHALAGIELDELDPWIIAEGAALDGVARRTDRISRSEGFAAWPAPAAEGTEFSAPSLMNLPTALDLPFTTFISGGLAAPLGRAWTLGGQVLFRRTENLFRRVDLNLRADPSGVTEAGMEVWGTLSQRGTVVRERPGTSRRFEEFDRVWTPIQDGWSRYLGFTVFAERRVKGGLELSAWYTFSSTEDNLVGLGTGRGELVTPRRVPGTPDWTEGTSDFDVPSRFGGALALPLDLLQGLELRARYRFEDGLPYTPSYAPGVDLDGDGIPGNEPLRVPSEGLAAAGITSDCVLEDRGRFVTRNGCRRDAVHGLDLGLRIGLVRLGRNVLALQVDGLNLTNSYERLIDPTLVAVDPESGLTPDGTAISPSLLPAQGFGQERYDTRNGRVVRIGLRWGGGE